MASDSSSPPRNEQTRGSGLEISSWSPFNTHAPSVAVTSTSSLSYLDKVKLVNRKIVYEPTIGGTQECFVREQRAGLSPTAGSFLRTEHPHIAQEKTPQQFSSNQNPQTSSNTAAESYFVGVSTFDDQGQAPQKVGDLPRESGLQANASSSSSEGIILELPERRNLGTIKSKPRVFAPEANLQVMENPKRAGKWPTAADVKYNPRNHPARSEGYSNNDIPSNEADYGEGARVGEPGGAQGYQLADWTGGFAPAPVDWDDRPRFVDNLVEHRIQEWKRKSDPETTPVKIGIRNVAGELSNYGNADSGIDRADCSSSTLPGEIAIQSWVPKTIDGLILEDWWNRHLKEPGLERDIEPFWQRFAANSWEFLDVLPVPDAVLEPSDNDMIKAKRQTAEQSMLTYDNRQLRKAQDVRKNREEQRVLSRALNEYVPSPNPHAPRVNIYLRPLEDRDLDQIAAINNHYIKNTIHTPETAQVRPSAIRSRWEDIAEARLPFLVAVDRSSKGTRRKGPNKNSGQDEHILGFGLADDYNDINGMYRYTVEIEVFIKPEFIRCGLGRCLLDKLLVILDPHYVERGGYEFFGDSVTYGSGGKRVVSSILINFPYNRKDTTNLEWLQNWLKQFDFEKCGDFPAVGHKLNTIVNQAIFMKKTGSAVEAGAL